MDLADQPRPSGLGAARELDPVDRMLIAQARVEKLRAISANRAWRDYELDLATV